MFGYSSDEEIPNLENCRGQGFQKEAASSSEGNVGRTADKKASKRRGSSDIEDSGRESGSDSDTDIPLFDDNYKSDCSAVMR